MGVSVRGHEVGVEHLVLGPRDRTEDCAGLVLARNGEIVLAQDLLHQRLLVVRVVDHEMPVETDRRAVAAQNSGAQGMERAHGDLATRLLAHETRDAGPQLSGRLVGEGHRQDLPRPNAFDADQVRDAVGEHAGLAAARPGQDQDRAVCRLDGALLLGIEARQDAGGERVGGSLALGQGDRLGFERRRLRRLDTRPVEGLRRSFVGQGRRLLHRERRQGLDGIRGRTLRRRVRIAGEWSPGGLLPAVLDTSPALVARSLGHRGIVEAPNPSRLTQLPDDTTARSRRRSAVPPGSPAEARSAPRC